MECIQGFWYLNLKIQHDDGDSHRASPPFQNIPKHQPESQNVIDWLRCQLFGECWLGGVFHTFNDFKGPETAHITHVMGYIWIYFKECNQWEFQDPKMEVLYHIRPYFGGRYLHFRIWNSHWCNGIWWDWFFDIIGFRFMSKKTLDSS